MLVAEIFHSIQGEGELTGVPSVFLRTSGCNLRCNWCDTKYASWKPEGEELHLDEIVNRMSVAPTNYCVITGGEPMLAAGIGELTHRLKSMGKHVTIETAATLPPNDVACDLASLSPKLTNSIPDNRLSARWQSQHDTLRLRPEVIHAWLDKFPCQLKFVVTSARDIHEIQEILTSLSQKVLPQKVLLMPEGTDSNTLHGRSTEVYRLCMQYGYRFCSRLHIELFGNTRGT